MVLDATVIVGAESLLTQRNNGKVEERHGIEVDDEKEQPNGSGEQPACLPHRGGVSIDPSAHNCLEEADGGLE
jgi:hypothetical protein